MRASSAAGFPRQACHLPDTASHERLLWRFPEREQSRTPPLRSDQFQSISRREATSSTGASCVFHPFVPRLFLIKDLKPARHHRIEGFLGCSSDLTLALLRSQ